MALGLRPRFGHQNFVQTLLGLRLVGLAQVVRDVPGFVHLAVLLYPQQHLAPSLITTKFLMLSLQYFSERVVSCSRVYLR